MYNATNFNWTVQVKSMENQENKKIVVLQVLPELGQGGVELGTIEIASELQKQGIENYVASEGGRMEYNLDRIKVKHFTLPLKTKNIFKMYLNSLRLAKLSRNTASLLCMRVRELRRGAHIGRQSVAACIL